MTTGNRAPTARLARGPDAATIAALLMDGLGDKLRPALGRRGAARLATIIHGEIAQGEPYYVVDDRGGVAGAAHLDLGSAGTSSSVGNLASVLGWPRTVWALVAWSLIDAGRRRPDDAYIEELVVAPRARRQGVAGALLDACETRARTAGRDTVRLIVVWDNAPAIALYRSAGYSVAARHRWLLGRLVYGSRGAFLMEKRLWPPIGSGARS